MGESQTSNDIKLRLLIAAAVLAGVLQVEIKETLCSIAAKGFLVRQKVKRIFKR